MLVLGGGAIFGFMKLLICAPCENGSSITFFFTIPIEIGG
jgi:hypothetical protein